ncbi:MAG: glycogen/starch synthase [Pseudomonadota bacterium]
MPTSTTLATLLGRVAADLAHLDPPEPTGVTPPHLVVALLSWENPWAVSGGVRAVAEQQPRHLRAALAAMPNPPFQARFLRVSPLHAGLPMAPRLGAPLASCRVPYGGRQVEVCVHQAEKAGETWLLLEVEGFFRADGFRGDPYLYAGESRAERDGAGSFLLRDALFASLAAPAALAALGYREGLLLHAQDWEFAAVAWTARRTPGLVDPRVVLTLHNPYDHWLPDSALAPLAAEGEPLPPGFDGQETVLARMIPLLHAPPSVVSHRFAWELTHHPLQCAVLAPHLQGLFAAYGLVAIDNGTFLPPAAIAPFTPAAVAAARASDPGPLLAEKRGRRRSMLRVLEDYQRAPAGPIHGHLDGGDGRPLSTLPDDVPVFMAIGRLDPGQKGYDLIAQAIRTLPRGSGRFLLTPVSPLAEDEAVAPFFQQLVDLAAERPGEVAILAHRLSAGFLEAMRGATWSLWASLYEPFGGVNEFFGQGTPAVACATGGLVQQVVDHDAHPGRGTGLLFPDALRGAADPTALRACLAATPEERPEHPFYRAQVEALRGRLQRARDLYAEEPAAYAAILANLGEAYDLLGWEGPAAAYLRWYAGALAGAASH